MVVWGSWYIYIYDILVHKSTASLKVKKIQYSSIKKKQVCFSAFAGSHGFESQSDPRFVVLNFNDRNSIVQVPDIMEMLGHKGRLLM